MLLEEIYFREHEYVHYLFCLYPRGFFSPSVSARPQTPFWLTADSTIMKEKVEPLILLKLSQKYYLNHKQEPTLLISLNRSSSNSAFVFSGTKGSLRNNKEMVLNYKARHTKSKFVFVFVFVFAFVLREASGPLKSPTGKAAGKPEPLHAVLTGPGIIDAPRHPTNKSIAKVYTYKLSNIESIIWLNMI